MDKQTVLHDWFGFCSFAPGPAGADKALFDRLRVLRTELARQARVPAYVIFHDAVLLKLSELQPATAEDLLSVPGIGAQKAAIYGSAVLKVISEWNANHGDSSE